MVATLLAAGTIAGPVWAQVPPSKAAAADAETKQLLLLMDQDRNGKISRQEFMNFMAAEFGRLDANKDGELDVYELTGLRVRRSVPGHQGK
jgi:Ca2+-binding EF-hand superfamily protein